MSEFGTIVAAFPAAGKSHYADRNGGVLDSDSSAFSWKWITFDVRERHPDWPANYIAHITEACAEGRTVLVSTHAEVREALFANGIPYTLVYPHPALREEYRRRMTERGSHPALIAKVIDELWTGALVECAGERGCVHVVLRSGEYLSDVLGVHKEAARAA